MNWLKDGYPFEIRRPEYATEVKFGGYVRYRDRDGHRNHFVQEGYQSVRGSPLRPPHRGLRQQRGQFPADLGRPASEYL